MTQLTTTKHPQLILICCHSVYIYTKNFKEVMKGLTCHTIPTRSWEPTYITKPLLKTQNRYTASRPPTTFSTALQLPCTNKQPKDCMLWPSVCAFFQIDCPNRDTLRTAFYKQSPNCFHAANSLCCYGDHILVDLRK